MDRSRSQAAFARAKRLIPGGVNSPARAFGAVGGEPIYIARGEGAYLFDIDGNRYIDFIGSWGPLILGHAHPRVVESAIGAAHAGSTFGAPTERESELAQLICEAMPAVEMVRMVSSGTEAAMSAVRLARGFTGRDVIVKFAGCYHGHVDSLLVAAGSSALTHGVPNSPGVPQGCTKDTVVLNYNDVGGLNELFRSRGDEIAGVLLEPVAGNMGLVTPSAEFRHELRRLTTRYGALLVYDEVMTGFRLAYGGAQQLYGDVPDLTILGKIIGGGYPVGAYGGRRDIMRKVMPAGPVFQAGTLSGNPVAMAAGIATLRELKERPPYTLIEERSAAIENGLRLALQKTGRTYQINRVGSMWTLFFTNSVVTDLPSAKTCDTAAFGRFFWKMLERGVYLPCSQFEAAFTSSAHSSADVESTIEAARESLQELTL